MNTHTATTLTRRLAQLLCWHLTLAMTLAATFTLTGLHTHRTPLYLTWTALPLTTLAWALTRAHEKRLHHHNPTTQTLHPHDWTPTA
ncbi:hypothetical protein G3I40_11460 [Streptomyces sp. SID14478]|uniref:hypothetical protein n=1 Tax=Streptomyces sp. SID14478 TaxID=2706073 RepID=UPI0013D9319B|nr:hypothetical protein [Streptomyces sp. SID14478]NEB75838.1 hypothetical protein [Streptomyces sp. SID14478]